MPSISQVAQNLTNKYIKYSPQSNQVKIEHIVQVYRDRRNVPRNIAEKAVMALYLPSAYQQRIVLFTQARKQYPKKGSAQARRGGGTDHP